MISVVLPTRGIVFTEVEESLESNLRDTPHRVYRSHNLKIPDSVNTLTDQALRDNPTHILFVEEDTVMPENGFNYLLMADADIACIDYAVAGWSCITKDNDDTILWCGLGCTLVRREVFGKLDRPYFRTDKALLLNDWPIENWVDVPEHKRYGGQDIWFFMKARDKGFKIVKAKGECCHLRLMELGKPEINNGLHVIVEKEKITKHQVL